MRHPDFEYILGEFKRYYKDPTKAMAEYTAWLNALKLNDNKSYGQSRESFQWAKDMITRFKEDAANVYYKVLLGFPTKSMNRNIYKERDLVAAAHTLVGKHPSINHKDDYWLAPKEQNPHNRWGVVTVVAAAPEEGAVEAILQVPKTALCPVCNGAKLTELIDAKRIYNVSLEGQCNGNDQGACDGFEFTEHGFSLLTSDVLPGIPMAKIYPMESYLAFLPQKPSGTRSIIIKGLTTTSEGELSGMKNPDDTINVVQPDDQGQCPQGMMWSARVNGCVNIDDGQATVGFDTRKDGNKASSDLRKARAGTGRQQFTPVSTKQVLDQGGSAQKWHTTKAWKETDSKNNDGIPNRAMGNADIEQSDVGIDTQRMPGGDKLQPGLGTDHVANTAECKTAGDMGKLAGKTNVILDAGSSDRHHPDNDDQWLIEKGGDARKAETGGVGTFDGDSARKDGAPSGGSPLDRPNSTARPDNQPAFKGKSCPNGMRWSDKDDMCVFDAPQNESTFNPTGPCMKGQVYDAHEGKCVTVEGPNIKDEPDSANDAMGKPMMPPIDQPSSAGLTRGECPSGYTFDPDTGQCEFDAPQTETIQHGDARRLTDKGTQPARLYNPGSPTSNVRHGQPADTRGSDSCRDGMVFDPRSGMCVVLSDQNEAIGRTAITSTPKTSPYISNSPGQDQCTDGLVWNQKLGMCVPTDDAGKTGDRSNIANTIEASKAGGKCPPGMVYDSSTGICVEPSVLSGECKTVGDMGKLAGKTNTILDAGGSDKWHPDNDDAWLIEGRRRLEEPFAGYKNWADCIAKNKGKGDADKICGSIKAKTEYRTMNHELELSQALSRAATAEATISQMLIEYDATVKGLKALVAAHWQKYQEERDVRMALEGRLRQQAETLDGHEDRTRTANNERVELETKLSRRERDLQEALENSAKFKKLYEALQADHEATEAKYREALTTNLALNKQMTRGNEDYLRLAKEKEELEEQLKKSKRLAKHIVQIKPF